MSWWRWRTLDYNGVRMNPGVSILIPTYGRTSLLKECVYSALSQVWSGRIEIIVLNDCVEQQIQPISGVLVINAPQRYATLGDKRTALVRLATMDRLQMWDDDDIALPDHVAKSVASLDRSKCPAVRSTLGYVMDGTSVTVWNNQPFHSATMWTEAMLSLMPYASMDDNEDIELCQRAIAKGWFLGDETIVPHGTPTWIYRPSVSTQHATKVGKLTLDTSEPTGAVDIVPIWDSDYAILVRNAGKPVIG